MLAIIKQGLLFVHVLAGALTLVAGPAAIFYNFRNPARHRRFGKLFYTAMLFAAASAALIFFYNPGKVFYQFLLGIAIMVACGVMRGSRLIRLMQGGRVNTFDFAYTVVLAANGLFMLAMSTRHFIAGTMIALPILFGVFGLMSCADAVIGWNIFRRPRSLSRTDWMRWHSITMISAFTASTTAFFVNTMHFLPWYLQWFGPALLLTPLQIYFGRKLRKMKLSA